ncbi:MAG: hypothetical protein DYG99_05330 [Bacteroidetes bacterium CHB5]|nr:hypothetical protein [Bacteroidetes bacterium CHB5]
MPDKIIVTTKYLIMEYRNNIASDLGTLASLVDFPVEGIAERIKEAQLLLDGKYPEVSAVLEPFTDFVSMSSLDQVQELYTRTFEVQAITTLDVGYLLFGDDYKRAELLVNLIREHAKVGNDCGYELADHLPNIIRLTSHMQDEEIRQELIEKIICPGLKKMISEFDPMNVHKKNELYVRHHKTLIDTGGDQSTLYHRPLVVLLEIIRKGYNIQQEESKDSGFMASIDVEMKLEE